VQYPEASNVFEKNLSTFIDRVRKDTGNPDLPIILVQLARLASGAVPGQPGKAGDGKTYDDLYATYTQAWDRVREFQQRMPDQRKNVYVVATVDLYPMVDPIHLDFGAYQRLGPRIAEVALSEIYKVPGHSTPIRLGSVEVQPLPAFKSGAPVHGHTLIRVRFTGVNGRLMSAGRPSGFSLHFPEVAGAPPRKSEPVIYAIEFDPQDPASVLLKLTGEAAELKKSNAVLYYGEGLNPYCNIVDDKDMAVPAFGPVPIAAH
jgi:sialate O-acetylesterase